MDTHNLKVFVICAYSVVGALPLGIIITSDETTDTLVKAFSLYKEALPTDAFFGKGLSGPAVFMTDNCSELRDALHIVWPEAILLLCLFHILQQVWRWLCDSKNSIKHEDRQTLMHSFKTLAYEPCSDEFETKFNQAIAQYDENSDDEDDENFVSRYPQFVAYLKNVCELKTSWALCHRSNLMLRGHNTNNTAESQFLVMKDKILLRIKEYNAVALFEKIAIDLSDHYMDKLLSVSSGSYDSFTSRRFDGKTKKKGEIGFKVPSPESQKWMVARCSDVGLHRVRVPSETTPDKFYIVDMFPFIEFDISVDFRPILARATTPQSLI